MTTHISSTTESPLASAPAVIAAASILVSGVLAIVADHAGGAIATVFSRAWVLHLTPPLVMILYSAVRIVVQRRPVCGGRGRVHPERTRLRRILGIALAVVMAGRLAVVYTETQRPPAAALEATSIRSIRGTSLTDLRPSSSSSRSIPVELTEIRTQEGWTGSAHGRLYLIWEGPEHLLRTTGEGTVVPHRGDTIEVEASFPRAGRSVLWVDPEAVRVEAAPRRDAVVRRWVRGEVRRRLSRLPRTTHAMAVALLLGSRGEMEPDTMTAVRGAGASHVIALSGMHLGVVALLLSKTISKFVTPRVRRVVVASALIGYVWVAGWIPSLVRALLVACLVLVAGDRDRSLPPGLLLGRCVVLTAVIAPRMVWSLGFQLSLWALVGLLFLSPRVVDLLTSVLPRPIAGYVGVTLGPLVATAPLSLVVFGTVYPVGVLSAGVLALCAVLLMWGSITFLVVAQVPIVGSLVAMGLTAVTGAFLTISSGFSTVPGVDISQSGGLISLVGWGVPATVLLGGALVHRRRRWRPFRRYLEAHDTPQFDF
ncbi:MAG: ComEC/Rec2 family competence protein [Alkalispirochaeta sp.]